VLAARYPAAEHKLLSITNGFDPDFVPRGLRPAGTGGVMELCHFGTVYAQRSPRHLLEALAAVLEAAAGTLSRRLRVRFIGGWEIDDAATNALADRLEAAGLITREPALPHAACLAAMRQAPALLVLQPASPLQIPGKLYEYIASGRPLVVVGGEGATAGLVERERLGVCSPDRTDAIAAMLRRVLDQPESLDAPAADRVAMFDYRILTARLAAALAEITRLPLTTAA
jgi:glycosyltransferase involved in cell wall biosynthesis